MNWHVVFAFYFSFAALFGAGQAAASAAEGLPMGFDSWFSATAAIAAALMWGRFVHLTRRTSGQ